LNPTPLIPESRSVLTLTSESTALFRALLNVTVTSEHNRKCVVTHLQQALSVRSKPTAIQRPHQPSE